MSLEEPARPESPALREHPTVIGHALAEQLAQSGARLVLAARSMEKLQTLATSLTSRGLEAAAVATDVTIPFRRTRMRSLEFAQQRLGGLDVLINNAGIGSFGHFADCTESILRQVMEVNFASCRADTARPTLFEEQGRRPAIVQRRLDVRPARHAGVVRILGQQVCPGHQALSESLPGKCAFAAAGVDVLVILPGVTKSDLAAALAAKFGPLCDPFRPGHAS